jgi:hypothetical protein
MATFTTTEGEAFTGHDLAELIRQEGFLIVDSFVSRLGHRCARGVIDDLRVNPYSSRVWVTHRTGLSETYFTVHRSTILEDNDHFRGTGAARAEYMAQRLEALDAPI